MSPRLTRRIGIVVAAMAGALTAALSPANAASGPAVSYFTTAVPVVGGLLSNSSSQPSFAIKDGWTVYDPSGVCSARTDFYNGSGTNTIWSFAGNSSTRKAAGKYQWNTTVGAYQDLETSATNCLGDTSSSYASIDPGMDQQGAATYGAGWSTAACACWSGGSAMKSTKVGASASYGFYGRMVSLVSDKATSRGSVSLYIDGRFQKTVSLATSGVAVNRVIVWNSPFLKVGSHILTLKVASGRVDVDAFITQPY